MNIYEVIRYVFLWDDVLTLAWLHRGVKLKETVLWKQFTS